MNQVNVIAQIDATRLNIHKAMEAKDLNAYIDFFSDDLIYTQADGRQIDKVQLQKDKKKYFSRIQSYESNFERIDFLVENDHFKETIIQKATVAIKVFLFFQKKWSIKRKGIYHWKKIAGDWRINQVKILQEQIN